MECILHIGTEKTGSTTLQHFLSLNRSRLLENGIAYTKTLGKTANNGICILSYPLDRRDHLTEDLKIDNNSDLKKNQESLKKKFQKELKKIVHKGNIKKLVISSELIQSRLTTVDDVHRLKALLAGLGLDKIKVIVYLRDPVLTAQSLFSTALKFGHTWERPPFPEDKYFGNICDHKGTIQRFATVFGEDSLTPRLFEEEDLIGNSIITDFFHLLQEPVLPVYKIPKNSNSSLSYTALSLLREINKSWPRKIDNSPNYKRRDLIRYLEKHSKTKYRISPTLQNEYEQSFKKSNEWVRKNFFPHKKSLFISKTKCNSSDYTETINPEEMAKLLMQVWEEKYSKDLLERIKLSARKIKDQVQHF